VGAAFEMTFELQPVLTGALIELRPLRTDDFEALFAVASDPAIWEQHPDRHRYRVDRFQIFFREAMASGGALLAADRANGAVIGSSRFYGYDEQASEVEIGWSFLARAYWGGRYNAEMKQLMLDHAFRFVERVVFLVGPDNLRSQHALAKIGALRVGTRPDPEGRARVLFEITRACRSAP
jgi:RimJ/RimL family protein N-acetyltransferase